MSKMMVQHGGLAWRLARLHPLMVLSVLFLGLVFAMAPAETLLQSGLYSYGFKAASGFAVLFCYPLFVILFVSGRFASRSPRRFKLPVAAFLAPFVFLTFVVLVLSLFGREFQRAFEAGSLIAVLPLWTLWSLAVLGVFYLWIGAAVALVEAERGPFRSRLQIFGTFLLFFYGPFFGWYFLHRRLRRLVKYSETRDPNSTDLPIEKLTIEKGASGHLGLVLTERIGWDEFEVYAGEILRRLDARVIERAITVDMQLWDIEVETVPLRLVYEDFPNRVVLESSSFPGDMLLNKLQARLSPAA